MTIAIILPWATIITPPGKMPDLIFLSCKDICGVGRFHMQVIGDPQITGGKEFSGQEGYICSNSKSFLFLW